MSNQSALTLAGLQEKFRKFLKEENKFTNLLALIENKTKINREYIAYGEFFFCCWNKLRQIFNLIYQADSLLDHKNQTTIILLIILILSFKDNNFNIKNALKYTKSLFLKLSFKLKKMDFSQIDFKKIKETILKDHTKTCKIKLN